ncbi:MAG: hypothetical protein KDA89_10140 [Planctomycetaceae bacterium]|nr:hypothetical protein [Planctomycetaceae bacterium]
MHSTTLQSPSFSLTPHASAVRSMEQVEVLRALLFSAVYYAFAHIGYWTSYDGVFVALGMALILPAWRPYLMLLVMSVHDAPGQADPSIYVSVAGIAGMMLATGAITRNGSVIESPDDRRFRYLAMGGVMLALIGIVGSWVHQRFGLHQQLEDRPFPVVGGLIALMILIGMLCHRALERDPWLTVRLKTICVIAVTQILVMALLQLAFGPTFGASPAGLHAIATRLELLEGGERGVARLTGPFLSPNTLAILPAFFMLLYLRAGRTVIISGAFILTFFTVGMTLSALGAARSMFLYYIMATGALMWTRSPQRVLLLAVCCLPLLLMMDLPVDDILRSMRLQNLESIEALGTRGLYWQCTLNNLTWQDWLLGFGLSHWPVFFQYYTGSMASDPHNWIMSMGGTYGILGLSYYCWIGWLLFKRSLSGSKKLRATSACLLLMYFGRDLANTQYLVNNHPMTVLYWMALGTAFSFGCVHPEEFAAEADAGNQMSAGRIG